MDRRHSKGTTPTGIAMGRAPGLTSVVVSFVALVLGACTYHVNSFVDAPDTDPGDRSCESTEPVPAGSPPTCTLRAAIMEANAGGSLNRIEVPSGTYTLSPAIPGAGGRLTIVNPIHIQGSGAGQTVIDGQNQTGIFEIDSADVTVKHLTVRDGNDQGGTGFLIRAGSDVKLYGVEAFSNTSFTGGGGLWVEDGATVRMWRSGITGNNGAQAGGIYNAGTLWIYDSSVTGNSSTRAGGIQNASTGALNLRNVTLAGNMIVSSSSGTGGLYNGNFAVLNNVTVTDNTGAGTNPSSFRGGGIQTGSGDISVVRNSIIAGNSGSGGPDDCAGDLASGSRHNLIGDAGGCGLPALLTGYILNQPPLLGVLVDVSGSPAKFYPLGGGLAESAGYPFPPPAADGCEDRDILGVPRHQDSDDCDLGAAQTFNQVGGVTGFMLVDADADTDIRPLRHQDTIYRNALPPNLAIRAVTNGPVESVVFDFDGTTGYRTENNAPFSLGGDTDGDHAPLPLSGKEYNLTATAYAAENGTGTKGAVRTITFWVGR